MLPQTPPATYFFFVNTLLAIFCKAQTYLSAKDFASLIWEWVEAVEGFGC